MEPRLKARQNGSYSSLLQALIAARALISLYNTVICYDCEFFYKYSVSTKNGPLSIMV